MMTTATLVTSAKSQMRQRVADDLRLTAALIEADLLQTADVVDRVSQVIEAADLALA